VWQIGFSLFSALTGVLQQVLMNLALDYEEASKVMIIRSTDLFFAFLLQSIFLHIYSDWMSVSGALMIFVATMLVMMFKMADKKWNSNNTDEIINSSSSLSAKLKRIFFYKI
jgi:uncharacterized membrane protein